MFTCIFKKIFYTVICPHSYAMKYFWWRGLEVSEFELQSRYNINFQINTLGEKYEFPYPTQLSVR